MNIPVTRIMICGLLFLLTLASGVWVSHAGKPINMVIFTIHKLIALATVIIVAPTVFNVHRAMPINEQIELTTIAVTVLLFIELFITRALLSRNGPMPAAILRIHQVAPLLALVSSTITIYVLVSNKA
jgi:hypothetical protein